MPHLALWVSPGASICHEETEPYIGYATSDRGLKSRALREQVPIPELSCSPALQPPLWAVHGSGRSLMSEETGWRT